MEGSCRRKEEAKCYYNLVGDLRAIDWNKLKPRWSHLKDLPLPDLLPDDRVRVIIGTQYLDAIDPIAHVVFGDEGEPTAKLCKLGWILTGRIPAEDLDPKADCRPVTTDNVNFAREMQESNLGDQWKIESDETFQKLRNSYSPRLIGKEEKQARIQLENNIQMVEETGRYRVLLLWKGQERPKPNYEKAKNMFLKWGERNKDDPEMNLQLREAIKKWLDNKFARIITKDPKNGYFIPTFVVIRLDKSTTKYRLILNGAARFGGSSIKDML